MNRLFGAKSVEAKPTLDQVIAQIDLRKEKFETEIAKCNAELTAFGSRSKNNPAMKQRAMRVLQRRKKYEDDRDQLEQQIWNLEQHSMLQDNLKSTVATVDAMKATSKAVKKIQRTLDIDAIEELQDKMAEMQDFAADLQFSMSRNYEVPDGIGDEELEAELNFLSAELNSGAVDTESELPAFLKDDVGPPAFLKEEPDPHPVQVPSVLREAAL